MAALAPDLLPHHRVVVAELHHTLFELCGHARQALRLCFVARRDLLRLLSLCHL
jgi:hypothetical protein